MLATSREPLLVAAEHEYPLAPLQLSDAVRLFVERALADIGDVTGRSWEAELHRQRAQILLSLDPSQAGQAESHLEKAVEVARRQSARSLELRAATSLAELWRTQGKADEAHALLAPIGRWFKEGAETADLKRARAVLHDTAGRS